MRFQNLVYVARAVSCDGRDLGHGATRQSKTHHRRPAKVVEVQVLVTKFRTFESRAPRCSKAVACPRFTKCVAQNSPVGALRPSRIEDDFKRRTYRNDHALLRHSSTTLVLLQADVSSIVL